MLVMKSILYVNHLFLLIRFVSKFKCKSNIIGKLFTKDTTIVKNFHYYWLSDLKYLDDIHGGIVMTKPNEKIIGLVFGNLRKLNGDGDLTIIVPIEKLSN